MCNSLLRNFFILGTTLCLVLASCRDRGITPDEQEARAKIDTSISHLQPQTDTGYRHSFNLYQQQLDSLEAVCKEMDYKNGLGRIYFMTGSMKRWRNEYDDALVWLGKSYSVLKGSNSLEEINTLLEIGDVYFNMGKKRFANEYYYRAMDISEEVNIPEAKLNTASRVSHIFFHQNSFLEALNSYKKTLRYAKDIDFKGEHNTVRLRLHNNIGVCYSKLNKIDSALMHYDSALMEAHALDTNYLTIAKGVVYGNMGHVYQRFEQYDKAIELLKRNISVNGHPNGDLGDGVTSYTYLLEIYIELDSLKEFNKIIDKVIQYTHDAHRVTMPDWRARLFGLKADYFAKTNQPQQAYEFRTRQQNLKDSIIKASAQEELQDVIMYRQLKEQEEELLLLQKDNKQQQIRIEIYLTLSILVIALLIVAVIALNSYRNNLKKQKVLNEQIAKQNQQITLSKTELEQAIEELKLLNLEKNRLLGMVAHDLRGPIYNITGVVQLLESSAGFAKMDESDAQLVDLIKKSCDNALEVINDLLDAAKLENGNFSGEMKEENLSEIIKNALKLYQGRAQQKQIRINFGEPAQNVMANVSKEKINRAIGNLLSNAIKFSNPKSAVNVILTKADDNALISVSDEGMGIPLADREIIFDKFTKAKRPGTDGEKPVGLGMSIVKQIVEAHGGRIWLESEVGAGTTFYIEIPLK